MVPSEGTEAPSTLIQIFFNPQLFLLDTVASSHTYPVYSADKSATLILNPLSRLEIFYPLYEQKLVSAKSGYTFF